MSARDAGTRRPSARALVVVALLVILATAGVASYYASAHPDGLESVAAEQGFDDAADESATAGGPLADYQTRGVEDPRLSGGLAGVAGVLVVLLLGGGLFWLVRGRGEPDGEGDSDGDARADSDRSRDVSR